jgi:hypothetical protein
VRVKFTLTDLVSAEIDLGQHPEAFEELTYSICRYDRAPLIRPILFKTVFYWAVVLVARLLGHWIRFWLVEHHPIGTFLPHMAAKRKAVRKTAFL